MIAKKIMDSDFLDELMNTLWSIIATLFYAMVNFITSLSESVLGQILIVLFFLLVILTILGNIYDANFKKDKIMDNKNKTGFFHPEDQKIIITEEEKLGYTPMRKIHLWYNDDVDIKPETVINFTDAYCGSCYLPIQEEDMFCANCGELLEDAKAKFLLENNWEELSKEFTKTMEESP